jgi:hypothetical protein
MSKRVVKRGWELVINWSYSSSIRWFKNALEKKRIIIAIMAMTCLIFIKLMYEPYQKIDNSNYIIILTRVVTLDDMEK